jgi:cytoskeletal protein RodZ
MNLCDNCDTEFTDTIMCDCEDKEYWELHDLRQEKQMKLTRRGWVVLVIIPAIIGMAGIMWLMNHINWMGDHYCFKTMVECYFPTK